MVLYTKDEKGNFIPYLEVIREELSKEHTYLCLFRTRELLSQTSVIALVQGIEADLMDPLKRLGLTFHYTVLPPVLDIELFQDTNTGKPLSKLTFPGEA